LLTAINNALRHLRHHSSGTQARQTESAEQCDGNTTLAVRRKRGDLIECYKILSAIENLDPYQFFQRSDITHLRGHSCKRSVNRIRCRLQLRQNFFSQRVISDWNKLPQDVVDAPSVNALKNRLDTHWKNTGYGHYRTSTSSNTSVYADSQ